MRIQEGKMSRKYSLNRRKLTTPQSFSLINIHKHMLDCKPIRSHGAEADCLALLRTMSALGNDWVDWVENNCKPTVLRYQEDVGYGLKQSMFYNDFLFS